MIKNLEADVAVIGAGPTGAYAALQMAKAGLNVLLLDRHQLGETGAQWVNTVPEWMLRKAHIKSLGREQIHSSNDPMILRSGCGQSRIDVGNIATYELDMRTFGKGLIKEFCLYPNAEAILGVEIQNVELDSRGRPVCAMGMLNHENSSTPIAIQARLFVDAGGLKGAIRRKVPLIHEHCPMPQPSDLCSAAQETYEISDEEGARAFLKDQSCKAGDMIAILGFAGGFSLLRIHLSKDLSTVSFLSGAIAMPQFPSGRKIISNFLKEHSWIGTRLFGGARIIPLSRPYAVLAAPGIALVGDAACQIYAAHGSGIGIGLLAAQILASCIADSHKGDRDIGALEELATYSYNFQHQFGHLLYVSDLLRRFSQRLSPNEIAEFLNSGLLTKNLLSNVLLQQDLHGRLQELPTQLVGALRHPRLIAKLMPIIKRLTALGKLCKQFPAWSGDYYARVCAYDQKIENIINLDKP